VDEDEQGGGAGDQGNAPGPLLEETNDAVHDNNGTNGAAESPGDDNYWANEFLRTKGSFRA
jgi:hypothetical protein